MYSLFSNKAIINYEYKFINRDYINKYMFMHRFQNEGYSLGVEEGKRTGKEEGERLGHIHGAQLGSEVSERYTFFFFFFF